jgi:ribonuclease D
LAELITKTSELRQKVEEIKFLADFITIDTEFVRERTYYPTLGLIQIGYADKEFAIDPLSDQMDLEPLFEILEDPTIVKVFHACGQDLEIFYNLMNTVPQNVFDTQIAAKILGYGESVSYSNLVSDLCAKKLNKSARFTDWTKRPLEENQIEYAIGDVSYLKEVYAKLVERLQQKNRYSWAMEEMQKVVDIKLYENNPDEAWRKLKPKSDESDYLVILVALARWREFKAQNENRPKGWILKDDAIQEIASIKPKVTQDLQNLRFFRYDDRLANDIVGIIDYALKDEVAPKIERERKAPKNAAALISLLRIVLQNQADANDVAPSAVANTEDLIEIALGNFDATIAMKGWRYEVFGKYAKSLKDGNLAITCENNRIIFIEPDYAPEYTA